MDATVVGLARFPVKSLLGEPRSSLELDGRGVVGDRLWAIRHADGKLGSGKSTRRFRRTDGLLGFGATLEEGLPVITCPDGRILRGDDPALHAEMSNHLGLPVTVAREAEVSHLDACPVSIVSTGSLRAISADARRFRMNVVIDHPEPWVEERWIGHEIEVGRAVLRIRKSVERCVMITLPQQELPAEPRLLKELAERCKLLFGIYAEVVVPGRIALGDRCRLGRRA